MGWDLFRRTTLKTSLVLTLVLLGATTGLPAADTDTGGPLPPVMHSPDGIGSDSHRHPAAAWTAPRQNHAAEKSWSIDGMEQISSRPEVIRWMNEWRSGSGLKKFSIASARSFPYRAEVDRIIRSSGLPWEVTAIPVVESNWRINAVSSSGAVGPWQFMAASARGRHLVIDAWRDDRRDVWRSTEAAMAELAFYDRLFSDWLIAVAGYNAGPTRIRRLRLEGGYKDFWEMLDAGVIPPETRNYVPQVIAVAWISSHAGRLGLPINWEQPTDWVRIPSTRSVHLGELSRVVGVPASEIYDAHRELNHPITPPPTLPYLLKVPADKAEKAALWLQNLDENGAPDRFWRYTVRSGDTLSGLAVRYNISLAELLSYNGHVRSGVLRIGERLYLPGTEEEPQGVDSDSLPDWQGSRLVDAGETLWSIAREYGISPELLAEVNSRSMAQVLHTGSVLKVPVRKEGEI